MNKIPRTFCITLHETPIRTNGFLEEAAKHNLSVELFYGSFGKRLGLKTKHPNRIEFPSEDVFMTDGEIGCTLSHYILWNVLLYQPEEEFLILEDDALFEDNFVEKFMDRYSKLPLEWQMVYVGWLFNGKDTSPITVKDGISIRSPSATHAYLVKKSILSKLCDDIQPIQSPIDLTIVNRILPTIKHYAFDPPLITQKSFRSLFNENDANWMSMVYDWEEDPLNLKLNALDSFRLEYGWYNLEKLNDDRWRWTSPRFSLRLPNNATNLKIFYNSPRKTEIELSIGGKRDIKVGDNILSISTQNIEEIEITVKDPFIPSENNEESTDNRSLGIMVTRLDLTFNGQDISFPIKNMQFSDV